MKTELYIFDMGGVVVRNFDVFPLIYEFLQVSREKFGSLSEDKFGLVSDGISLKQNFGGFFPRITDQKLNRTYLKYIFNRKLNRKSSQKLAN